MAGAKHTKMNRLLFNRSNLNGSFLVRNYTVKPLMLPLRSNIVKVPDRVVYKPIVYTFSTNALKQIYRSNSSYAHAPINIDTSTLAKDVIVFKYNNPKYFKLMNIFGLAQFFFWLICSEFTLSNLRYTPVNEGAPNFADLPLYLRINLGENKYKYGLAFGCFSFGERIKVTNVILSSLDIFLKSRSRVPLQVSWYWGSFGHSHWEMFVTWSWEKVDKKWHSLRTVHSERIASWMCRWTVYRLWQRGKAAPLHFQSKLRTKNSTIYSTNKENSQIQNYSIMLSTLSGASKILLSQIRIWFHLYTNCFE